MTKDESVAIENSYFYTTRKDLDSLVFNATQAEYDMKTQLLKVSGIPYIVVPMLKSHHRQRDFDFGELENWPAHQHNHYFGYAQRLSPIDRRRGGHYLT